MGRICVEGYKALFLSVMLILAGCMAMPPSGFSEPAQADPTYFVDQHHPQASDTNPGKEDLPWMTIQHAADMALPGDIVIVKPGSYGRTRMKRGGAPDDAIVFKGLNAPQVSFPKTGERVPTGTAVIAATYDGTNAYLENPLETTRTQGFELDADWIRLEGFEISNIPSGRRGAIYLDHASFIEIRDNYVHELNCTGYNYGGVRGAGDDVKISNNVFWRVEGVGISMYGSRWLVEGNDISHGTNLRWSDALEVGGGGDAIRFFGEGHVIRRNFLHDYLKEETNGKPHMDAFQTYSWYGLTGIDILIEGNTAYNFAQILMSEDQSEIFTGVNAVHHITLRNNIFRKCRAVAIIAENVDHLTLVNNVIAEAGYKAFSITGNSHHAVVMNNIFYNNYRNAPGSLRGQMITGPATKVGSVMDYNIHYPDFKYPPKQPEYETHGFYGVDPRFVDPEAGDYRLLPDSPAIDWGFALGEFSQDREGTPRPRGATWDIGALEFSDSAPPPVEGTYYVDKDHPAAADTNPGTEALPWKTLQHAADVLEAGQSVVVKPGTYQERVTTQKDGTSQRYITFKAQGEVVMKGFVIGHDYLRIEGFEITGELSANFQGAFFILPAASYVEIVNNTVHDVTTGASGVRFYKGGNLASQSAHHCLIKNNTFKGVSYHFLNIFGSNHVIEGNTFDTSNGYDAIRLYGAHHIIRNNLFVNISQKVGVSNHADILQTFGTYGSESFDMLFESNMIKDSAAQIGMVIQGSGYKGYPFMENIRDWTLRNNVFENVGAAGMFFIPEVKVYNNVFHNCTRNRSHVLVFGADTTHGRADYCQIKNNMFIGSGANPNDPKKGFFVISPDVAGAGHDYNYVAGAWPDYAPKNSDPGGDPKWNFVEAHGVNGGDPKFIRAPKRWVYADDNGVGVGDPKLYLGGTGPDSTTVEVNAADVGKFVAGEFIEVLGFGHARPVYNVARKITAIDGNVIAFTPALDLTGVKALAVPRHFPDNDLTTLMIILWGPQPWAAGDIITRDHGFRSGSPAQAIQP